MQSHEIEEARSRHPLSDIVRAQVVLHKHGRGFMGRCPFHKERTASFHVDDGRGTYKCFGCGAWGDVFDFLMLTKGLSFSEAVAFIVGEKLAGRLPRGVELRVGRSEADETDKRRIKHAHELWLRGAQLALTPAIEYLCKTRGLGNIHAAAGHLRYVRDAYCSPRGSAMGAVIAPLQDGHGHVTAVQQIFIDPETADCPRDERGRRIKRTLGCMRDGCVRLGAPEGILGLAGSVEDALSASEMFTLPVWATCGEGRMEGVFVPESIEHLIFFADADRAGREAAERAARRHGEGRTVEIVYPENAKDFNEMLCRRAAA